MLRETWIFHKIWREKFPPDLFQIYVKVDSAPGRRVLRGGQWETMSHFTFEQQLSDAVRWGATYWIWRFLTSSRTRILFFSPRFYEQKFSKKYLAVVFFKPFLWESCLVSCLALYPKFNFWSGSRTHSRSDTFLSDPSFVLQKLKLNNLIYRTNLKLFHS